MGTNYYLHEKAPCACCGRAYPDKHIGKSSGGWCFSLHVDPDNGIHDLPDWVLAWSQPGAYIKNEYGKVVSQAEMLTVIKRRSWEKPEKNSPYKFDYQANHANQDLRTLLATLSMGTTVSGMARGRGI